MLYLVLGRVLGRAPGQEPGQKPGQKLVDLRVVASEAYRAMVSHETQRINFGKVRPYDDLLLDSVPDSAVIPRKARRKSSDCARLHSDLLGRFVACPVKEPCETQQ